MSEHINKFSGTGRHICFIRPLQHSSDLFHCLRFIVWL